MSFGAATPEAALLREALRALGQDRPELRAAVGRVTRWDRVVALARAHAVSESLWAALALRGLAGAVPEPERTALTEDHAAATARNALLLAEAAELQRALGAEGIASVVLKGPGLLIAHYPEIGARHVGDIDLLVHPSELRRAVGVARALGARGDCVGHDGAELTDDALDHHFPTLVTAGGVALELHFEAPGCGPDVAGIFARARDVPWEGRALRIPSAADLTNIACRHVLEWHGGDERFLPRHLADLSVLVGAGAVTWDEVAALGPAEGAPALRLSRELLGGRAPSRLVAAALASTAYVKRKAALLGRSWRRSPRAVLRVLFPDRRYMAHWYGVRLDAPRLQRWFFYLWRLGRLGRQR